MYNIFNVPGLTAEQNAQVVYVVKVKEIDTGLKEKIYGDGTGVIPVFVTAMPDAIDAGNGRFNCTGGSFAVNTNAQDFSPELIKALTEKLGQIAAKPADKPYTEVTVLGKRLVNGTYETVYKTVSTNPSGFAWQGNGMNFGFYSSAKVVKTILQKGVCNYSTPYTNGAVEVAA